MYFANQTNCYRYIIMIIHINFIHDSFFCARNYNIFNVHYNMFAVIYVNIKYVILYIQDIND